MISSEILGSHEMNPLFMRNQLSPGSSMDRKFREEHTHSITQVSIHTINTFPLMCGHPVGAGFSVLNQTYLWTSLAAWQVGSETITVKCEDASMEVCEASTEDPGARLIS